MWLPPNCRKGTGTARSSPFPALHLSTHQRKAGWVLTGRQLKSKTRRCLKVREIEKEFTTFWLVIKRSTKLFCTEGGDVTALPGHHVAPAKAVTLVALVLPAINKWLGIIKECQRHIFKHLGSTLMSLFGQFHLCCRRAIVETQCYLQQLKQPSRGALCRTSQGMKVPADRMSRPLPTLYQDPWEDTTDLLSAGSHHNLWFWASVEKWNWSFASLHLWVVTDTHRVHTALLSAKSR